MSRRWRRPVRRGGPAEEKTAVEEKPAEGMSLSAAADVIEAMPIGVVITDLEGKELYYNKASEKMFRAKKGEGIGTHLTDWIVKEDVPRALEAFQEGLRKGYYRGFETTGVRKDGSKFPILVDGTVMRDSKGNPISIIITYRDITELKCAEEERAKMAAAAEAGRVAVETIEGMIDGVVITDLEGRIVQTNTPSDNMFGYGRGEAIGMNVTEFIPEEEVPKALELMSEALKTGKPARNVEFTGVRKDGSRFPILVNGSVLRDEEGGPRQLLIVYRDITELKRAEEERVTAFKRAADTVEAMIDPVIIYDLKGKVIQVNKAIEAYGYTREELIGKSTVELLVPERNRSRVAEGFKKALKNGSITRDVEVTLLTKDGREVPFVISGSPLRDREGKQICRIEVLRDISQLRHLEERERASDKARIEELEKFAKLATGREKRIIELKLRVKELEEKLKAK